MSLSCRPFTVVRFVVSAGNEDPRQFATEHEAECAAREAARRQGAADYWRVIGEPVTDLWRPPELLGGFVWMTGDESAMGQ